MRAQKTSLLSPGRVVGTIHSAGSLRRALRLAAGALDFLELRIDHFADEPETLLEAIPRLPAPLLVTVRHPREGGSGALSPARREELYRLFLPHAALLDLEVRSIEKHAAILKAARDAKVPVIISDHHFHSTPSTHALDERLLLARAAGAAVIKIATHLQTAAEFGRLLALFDKKLNVPLSLMGMGPLGQVSRLVFARLGSVLNYGYLDQAQVPGQWEATLLKKRLAELA